MSVEPTASAEAAGLRGLRRLGEDDGQDTVQTKSVAVVVAAAGALVVAAVWAAIAYFAD